MASWFLIENFILVNFYVLSYKDVSFFQPLLTFNIDPYPIFYLTSLFPIFSYYKNSTINVYLSRYLLTLLLEAGDYAIPEGQHSSTCSCSSSVKDPYFISCTIKAFSVWWVLTMLFPQKVHRFRSSCCILLCSAAP